MEYEQRGAVRPRTHALGLPEKLVLEHSLRPEIGELLLIVVLARHAPAVFIQDEDGLHLGEQFLPD